MKYNITLAEIIIFLGVTGGIIYFFIKSVITKLHTKG